MIAVGFAFFGSPQSGMARTGPGTEGADAAVPGSNGDPFAMLLAAFGAGDVLPLASDNPAAMGLSAPFDQPTDDPSSLESEGALFVEGSLNGVTMLPETHLPGLMDAGFRQFRPDFQGSVPNLRVGSQEGPIADGELGAVLISEFGVSSGSDDTTSGVPVRDPLKPSTPRHEFSHLAALGGALPSAHPGSSSGREATARGKGSEPDTAAMTGAEPEFQSIAGTETSVWELGATQSKSTAPTPELLLQRIDGADPAVLEGELVDQTTRAPQDVTASSPNAEKGREGPRVFVVPATGFNDLLIKSAQDGTRQFTVKLQPEDLGQVEVSLEFGREGRIAANITVERAETLELLARDSRAIEKLLSDHGFELGGHGLNLNLSGGDSSEQAETQRDGIPAVATPEIGGVDLQAPLHHPLRLTQGMLDLSV